MIRNLWLLLCCTLLATASLPSICRAQPDSLPPPAPGEGQASPSDAPGAPITTEKQFQAPIQAPAKAAPAAPQVITCTVMVPQITYKTITVPDIVCRPETRQKNVSFCRLVPETTMVTKTDTIVVPEQRSYATVAGYVLAHLQHLPQVGEQVDAGGWTFEVVDLDGRRIDKVLASRRLGSRRPRGL